MLPLLGVPTSSPSLGCPHILLFGCPHIVWLSPHLLRFASILTSSTLAPISDEASHVITQRTFGAGGNESFSKRWKVQKRGTCLTRQDVLQLPVAAVLQATKPAAGR